MQAKRCPNSTLVCGIRTCLEILKFRSADIFRVYLVEGKNYPSPINEIDKKLVTYTTFEHLNKLTTVNNASHQGIVMEVSLKPSIAIANLKDVSGTVAILDNVTDPHNVGAIIRSAAVFGIKAVIVHNRSACPISATVAKTSSGGLSHVQIYSVSNLANTIKELKKYGFWVVSLSEKSDKYLHEVNLHGKICIILGAESTGIRRLQIENSDFTAKLPTTSYFSTLNVSNAAAVAFYEIARQNEFKMG